MRDSTRPLVLVCLIFGALASGCLDGGRPDAAPAGPEDPAPTLYTLTCRLVNATHVAISPGTCTFGDSTPTSIAVDADGVASRAFPVNTSVTLTGAAPGYAASSTSVLVDGDVSVQITLTSEPRANANATHGGGATTNATPPPATPAPSPQPAPPARPWSQPVHVTDAGNEPQVAVGADGTIFYSPLSALWRSQDGGATWSDISPGVVPVVASDTSVSIAPDGSVWFSRTSGYAGSTIGCRSIDNGDSWTCNEVAIPGATDRMWIVGLDANTGIVQTNQGLEQHWWAETTDGSQTYAPTSVATYVSTGNGNMVYDATNHAVWQIEERNGLLRLLRIDTATVATQEVRSSDIPGTYAIAWLDVRAGALWTTGEPSGSDGSRDVVAARSLDQGETWQQFAVQSRAASVTFSYVAAGPDGRAALVYYGSDTPGPSTDNGGTWSVYVAETDNALDPQPIWTERLVVPAIHVGNICTGLNCETTGDDPAARFSGDLIGIDVDDDGLVHIAYNHSTAEGVVNGYVSQWQAPA